MRLGIAAVLIAGVFARRRFRLHAERPGRQPSRLRDAQPSRGLGAHDRLAGRRRRRGRLRHRSVPRRPRGRGAAGLRLRGQGHGPVRPAGRRSRYRRSPGVAAARANNGVGGVGACFDCRVMPLRVLGRDNIALNTNTAAAIDYARRSRRCRGEREHLRRASRPRGYATPSRAHVQQECSSWRQPGTRGHDARVPGGVSRDGLGRRGDLGRRTLASFSEPRLLGEGRRARLRTGHRARRRHPRRLRHLRLDAARRGIVALLRTRAPFASADELERALTQTARACCRNAVRPSLTPPPRCMRSGIRPPRLLPAARRRCRRRGGARGLHRDLVRSRRRSELPLGALQRRRLRGHRRSDTPRYTPSQQPMRARSSASSSPRPGWSRPHPRERPPIASAPASSCNDLPSSGGRASLYDFVRAPGVGGHGPEARRQLAALQARLLRPGRDRTLVQGAPSRSRLPAEGRGRRVERCRHRQSASAS